jgi:hypothetical protein
MIIRRIVCAVAVAALVSGFAPLAAAEHHEGGEAAAECVKAKDMATAEEWKAYKDAKQAAKMAGEPAEKVQALRDDWTAKMSKRAKEQGKALCAQVNPCNPCNPCQP